MFVSSPFWSGYLAKFLQVPGRMSIQPRRCLLIKHSLIVGFMKVGRPKVTNYAKGEVEWSSACKSTFRNDSCKGVTTNNKIMYKYSMQGFNIMPSCEQSRVRVLISGCSVLRSSLQGLWWVYTSWGLLYIGYSSCANRGSRRLSRTFPFFAFTRFRPGALISLRVGPRMSVCGTAAAVTRLGLGR